MRLLNKVVDAAGVAGDAALNAVSSAITFSLPTAMSALVLVSPYTGVTPLAGT